MKRRLKWIPQAVETFQAAVAAMPIDIAIKRLSALPDRTAAPELEMSDRIDRHIS